MSSVRVVVAAQSRVDEDRICRFLDTKPAVSVVAEVRDAVCLMDTVRSQRPDVTILSAMLPGLGDLADAVRSLGDSAHRLVVILPDGLQSRAKEMILRQLGVRALLTGPFDAPFLMQAISRVAFQVRRIAVVGASGGSGQTTVALGLIGAVLRSGRAVTAMDQGRRKDLTAFVAACPALRDHPNLTLDTGTGDPAPDVTLISDGPLSNAPTRYVLVVSGSYGSRRALEELRDTSTTVVRNRGVGDSRGCAGLRLFVPSLRPGLLEMGGDLSLGHRQLSTFSWLLNQIEGGATSARTLPRDPGQPHVQHRDSAPFGSGGKPPDRHPGRGGQRPRRI